MHDAEDDGDNAKAMAIPQVFSENSLAKNYVPDQTIRGLNKNNMDLKMPRIKDEMS